MIKHWFAEFISTIFHPVIFILSIPFFVVYRQTDSGLYALKWTAFTSAFILIGVMFYLYGRFKGYYTDHDLSIREQRHSFYAMALISALLYFLAAVFFKGIFFPLSIIALGVMLGVIVFELVTYYIKASVHFAAVFGWIVAMWLIYGITPAMASLWIIPLVGWSRLTLRRHTRSELFVGALLGTIVTIFTYVLGRYLFDPVV